MSTTYKTLPDAHAGTDTLIDFDDASIHCAGPGPVAGLAVVVGLPAFGPTWCPVESPPPWWQPVPGVRLLDSAHALWVEGEELAHCVAGYVGAVQGCRSVIVGLQAPDGSRSTVEIDRATKTVIQHRGWRNGVPSAACERLLAAMLVAWRGWS